MPADPFAGDAQAELGESLIIREREPIMFRGGDQVEPLARRLRPVRRTLESAHKKTFEPRRLNSDRGSDAGVVPFHGPDKLGSCNCSSASRGQRAFAFCDARKRHGGQWRITLLTDRF